MNLSSQNVRGNYMPKQDHNWAKTKRSRFNATHKRKGNWAYYFVELMQHAICSQEYTLNGPNKIDGTETGKKGSQLQKANDQILLTSNTS